MNTCCIFGAAEIHTFQMPEPGDFVIAADAGYLFLLEKGIAPDLIVGDFDSLGAVPDLPNVVAHPVMKDDTDMLLAVKLGLERGYKDFVIYGGVGGRTDHTVANIHTLEYIANRGGRGTLVGAGETMTLIRNGAVRFPAGERGVISVFAWGGKAEGVTERGLLYPLEEAALTTDYPLGVSNEFTGREASVSVRAGALLIIRGGFAPQTPRAQ